MRQRILTIFLTLSVAAGLAACAKKEAEKLSSVSEDSLLASDPIEPPSSDLTPQQPFEPSQEPSQEPPHRAPRPAQPAQRGPTTQHPQPAPAASAGPARKPEAPGMVVQWGSFLHVAISEGISSETAQPGSAWTGTLRDTVFVGSSVAFPAGSVVHGTVKDAKPAKAGDRALLALEVTSIDAFGKTYPVSATTDPIIAGSPRARNLGGIAAGAAAGALIGSAVGGGKGSLVGGLVGGAAAGGAVARSKGFEVVVKPGASVTFTMAGDVVVRR